MFINIVDCIILLSYKHEEITTEIKYYYYLIIVGRGEDEKLEKTEVYNLKM